MTQEDAVNTAKSIIENGGRAIFERAKKEVLSETYCGGKVKQALDHFVKVSYKNILPVFPTLLNLSCQAVGDKPQNMEGVGAALTMIAWAADIHDDIIDQSQKKYSELTVYGKGGSSISILAGDALLIQGSMMLSRECESLSQPKRRLIQTLVSEALFEISKAEALEIELAKKRFDVLPSQFLEVLKLKAVVPEVQCKVGAILGSATEDIVEKLGSFGRTYGVVSLMLEEIYDLEDYEEMRNRLQNECLPLPLLTALESEGSQQKLKALLTSEAYTRKRHKELLKLAESYGATGKMKQEMTNMVGKGLNELQIIRESEAKKNLLSLLQIIGEKLF
jgi:geranylgeranyl pyrophosphate synthase